MPISPFGRSQRPNWAVSAREKVGATDAFPRIVYSSTIAAVMGANRWKPTAKRPWRATPAAEFGPVALAVAKDMIGGASSHFG